jgi:uncharacterized membrane protein YgcG
MIDVMGSLGSVDRGGLARALVALLVAAFAVALIAATAAAMRSTQLGPRLCETRGGGKIVRIPGFPGEKIDRRLLADIEYLRERFNIFVTDGYSLDPVHSANGEHPLGLGLDVVPNKAEGGRWRDIDRLAEWAEPRQNKPRPPFRWVGYDGDPGHGRGHHLHLSWTHSPAKYDTVARMVQTVRCPGSKPGKGDGGGGGNTGGTGSYGPGGSGSGSSSGGGNGSGSGGSGGIGARPADIAKVKRIERIHRETGGVSAP